MRHRNPKSYSIFYKSGTERRVPYTYGKYTYGKPSPERAYVKVVKFVAEHPNCKRIDIIRGIWRPNAKAFMRGHQSSLLANLLYEDFIDYNRKYEYSITPKGYELLKRAGI